MIPTQPSTSIASRGALSGRARNRVPGGFRPDLHSDAESSRGDELQNPRGSLATRGRPEAGLPLAQHKKLTPGILGQRGAAPRVTGRSVLGFPEAHTELSPPPPEDPIIPELDTPPAITDDSTAPPPAPDPVTHPHNGTESQPAPFPAAAAIRSLMFLVALLHTEHQVSFKACDLLLTSLNQFLEILPRELMGNHTLPHTLTTVLHQIGLADRFKVWVTCPVCRAVFSPDSERDRTVCSKCSEPLYRSPANVPERLLASEIADGADVGKTSIGIPHLVTPMQPLSENLKDFFKRPGMVGAVKEWETRTSVHGELRSMQDGEVWKTIEGSDGKPFFSGRGDEPGVLRLGVTASLDWFGRSTSPYGPSHSSGVFSFTIQNLNNSLRYRAENLQLSFMPPGPTEPTCDQLQVPLEEIVDDLNSLWTNGVTVYPPECPNGLLVLVVLLAIIADHPAMCKLCGFADHSHGEALCTKCKVCHNDLFTAESLRNEFEARSGEEHRRLAFAYRALSTDEERAAFFAEHGVRWTAFAKLKYFDIVRQTVVDPMHNLLLGIAKTQWYTEWIKTGTLRADTSLKKRELSLMHEFLETFESPSWAGRLPLRVGEPAGGSLTADEYKFAFTGPFTLLIPLIWDRFCGDAAEEHATATERYRKRHAKWKTDMAVWTKKSKSKRTANPPAEPKAPTLRMQYGEEENFLRFATALKLLVGSVIRLDKLDYAASLLQEYLLGFADFYGAEEMKPNHHWSVHTIKQIRDFGPVYAFWAFLTERLNKLLKNLNSNNWTGGRLEVSMMREFHRGAALKSKILQHLSSSTLEWEKTFLRTISAGSKAKAIGTIQDAARITTGDRVRCGTVHRRAEKLDGALSLALASYYKHLGTTVRIDPAGPSTEPLLQSFVTTYSNALLDGRPIMPARRGPRPSTSSSIIQAPFGRQNEAFAGEIEKIFTHHQAQVASSASTILIQVRWMKRSTYTPLDNITLWNSFPELGVDTWRYNQYYEPETHKSISALLEQQADPPNEERRGRGPPSIIPASQIHSQLCRGHTKHTQPELWITTTMDRFTTTLSSGDFADIEPEESEDEYGDNTESDGD